MEEEQAAVRRPRWVVPVAVAATLVAAVAGATVTAAVTGSRPVRPGGAPAAAQAGERDGSSGTATVADGAQGTRTSTPAGAKTNATEGAARLAVGPVSLALPAGWVRLSTLSQEGRTQVCAAPGNRPCALELIVADDPARGFDPGDVVGGASLAELSPCHATAGAPNVPPYTTKTGQVRLDGVPAEYRVFDTGCGRTRMRWEQWTVPTQPGFQILSHADDLATTARLHDLVTRTTAVRERSTVRITDQGYVVAHRGAAGVVSIDLDRTAVTVLPGGGYERVDNTNPTAYRYVLAPAVRVRGDRSSLLCGAPAARTGTCPVTDFFARLDARNPQAHSLVRLVMDRAGRVVEIQARYGS